MQEVLLVQLSTALVNSIAPASKLRRHQECPWREPGGPRLGPRMWAGPSAALTVHRLIPEGPKGHYPPGQEQDVGVHG